MQREGNEKPSQAVVAAVQLPTVSDAEFDASLNELRELAKTLGFTVVRTFVQKRKGFDQTAYLGVGKREEISAYIHNEPVPDGAEWTAEDAFPHPGEIHAVLVDHEISPSQARNLEKETGCEVMDKMSLAPFPPSAWPLFLLPSGRRRGGVPRRSCWLRR